MIRTFEDFLIEEHEDYVGTKDGLIDDFHDWVDELSRDEYIDYGDAFAKEQSTASYYKGRIEGLKEGFKEAKEIMNKVFDAKEAS